MKKKQNIPTVRVPVEPKANILPISLFQVNKGHTFTTGSMPGRTLGKKLQSWTLTAYASDIEAYVTGNDGKFTSLSQGFTIAGTRADVNFVFSHNDESDGEDVAGFWFKPETVTDVQVLDLASVSVLIIND